MSPEVVQELRFVLVQSMDEVITLTLHVHTLSPAIEEAILAKPMERRKQKKT
ncbi:MAG TPA: hypothetical protein VFA10_22655 [Ktedonobacteraceae bacterium]|nr:hypothetical protein [Ktedonobacteraceae bacterium]